MAESVKKKQTSRSKPKGVIYVFCKPLNLIIEKADMLSEDWNVKWSTVGMSHGLRVCSVCVCMCVCVCVELLSSGTGQVCVLGFNNPCYCPASLLLLPRTQPITSTHTHTHTHTGKQVGENNHQSPCVCCAETRPPCLFTQQKRDDRQHKEQSVYFWRTIRFFQACFCHYHSWSSSCLKSAGP